MGHEDELLKGENSMEEYRKRYADRQCQDAYESACDCLKNRQGIKTWHRCGLDRRRALRVWWVAVMDNLDIL